MKTITTLAFCALALVFPGTPARADEEDAIPILTVSVESYNAFFKLVSTFTNAVDPTGKENPVAEMEAFFKEHPGAIDRSRPVQTAVWLNGMFQPLVAIYVPTKDFAALKKLSKEIPESAAMELEKMDGYGLFLAGGETSLEANLAAARAMDPGAIKVGHPLEIRIRFDDPTRTMLKGILAMGKLQAMQGSEQLGDATEAKMIKAALGVYFDLFDGFVDGMDETTFSLDIVDKGIRWGTRSTAKVGTTYAKLIAAAPMDPGPIAENYTDGQLFGISGRMAAADEEMAQMFGKMAALGLEMSGVKNPEIVDDYITMAKEMTPMYFSFGYDYSDELTASGIYHFTDEKDVPKIYGMMIELGENAMKGMTGKGKFYSEFKHDQLERDGLAIDRFFYKMGEDFPPNPITGDKMTIEYALKGNDMLFAMGGEGVTGLLKPREAAALPAFLKPDESTVMIGYLDLLAIIGKFGQLEVSHPEEGTVFIADDTVKGSEKNAAAGGDPGSKLLMRASIDGSMSFDFHIPLSLIRTMSRMK